MRAVEFVFAVGWAAVWPYWLKGSKTLSRQMCRKRRGCLASVGSVGAGVVGERSSEEAVGPVFGVGAAVGEGELDFGVADLEAGELVGEPVAVDVFELEQGAVAGLDDDGGEREFGESLELEGERPVGERRGEVVETLPLDPGEESPVGCVHGGV